jgi:hypothetical protein
MQSSALAAGEQHLTTVLVVSGRVLRAGDGHAHQHATLTLVCWRVLCCPAVLATKHFPQDPMVRVADEWA